MTLLDKQQDAGYDEEEVVCANRPHTLPPNAFAPLLVGEVRAALALFIPPVSEVHIVF